MDKSSTNHSLGLSENSKRIAKNTLLLYFRMLLMMGIGLFSSRVVLDQLGVSDFGVWNAVGGVVTGFTFITAAISNAISRFLAFEIGTGNKDRLNKVFATSVIVQLGLSLLLVLLVETVGLYLVSNKLNLPEGSEMAAKIVLHCSLGILVVNMLSVPFNATIVAHEKMGAFALISLIEAVLKLGVAFALMWSESNKLILYSFLMLGVAAVVRLCYGLYCRKHFGESRAKLVIDKDLLKQMCGFAGWSFLGSGTNVLNSQGMTVVVNLFFGVVVNAARGVAAQVDNIVKQFATNFLTALNPQITKSWASGNKKYCFELVSKGAKFTFLILLAFVVPLIYEVELLLSIWLKEVPELAADFTRLTLLVLLVDMTGNSLLTLQLATGRLKRYYLITGLSSLICLPLAWLVFSFGAEPDMAYWVLLGVYLMVFVLKLIIVSKETGFGIRGFLTEVLLPLAGVAAISFALPFALYRLMSDGIVRLILVCAASWMGLAVAAWVLALTKGEKIWALGKLRKFMSDKTFLKFEYYRVFSRRLNLRNPKRYTEWLQWLKLNDRNELYHKLVDKAEAKKFVSERIGSDYVVKTLGVWDSASEIDWNNLGDRFVLKCTHDSGSVWICEGLGGDGSGIGLSSEIALRRAEIEAQVDRALKRSHFKSMREWAYKGVRPRIMAEEWIGSDLKDYKFFCFDSVPKLMYVASERGVGATGADLRTAEASVDAGLQATSASGAEVTTEGTAELIGSKGFTDGNGVKFDFYDMEFRHLDIRNGHPNALVPPQKPQCFEEMKSIAAKLSKGMKQVRIDLYEIDGRVFFGEFTFYHLGGFVPFEPDEADLWIGSLWER